MAKFTQLVRGRAGLGPSVWVCTQGTKSWGGCGGRPGVFIATVYSWKLMLLPSSLIQIFASIDKSKWLVWSMGLLPIVH